MKWGPVTSHHDLATTDWNTDLTEVEAVLVATDELGHRMDNMMSMLLDLTQKVNAYR